MLLANKYSSPPTKIPPLLNNSNIFIAAFIADVSAYFCLVRAYAIVPASSRAVIFYWGKERMGFRKVGQVKFCYERNDLLCFLADRSRRKGVVQTLM